MPAATHAMYYRDIKPPKICTSYATRQSLSQTKSQSLLSPLTRELPMPTVTRITSLAQAQATLQHCWTKLSGAGLAMTPSHSSPPSSPVDALAQRRYCQRWLEQWEHAFTGYLSSAMSGMKGDEIARCRILKANHLACTVLASEGGSDPKSFDVFDAEFQAIVELANAVIQSRASSQSPSRSSSSRSASPTESNAAYSTLDVRDPLQVVISRCNRYAIRNHAVALASRLPRNY